MTFLVVINRQKHIRDRLKSTTEQLQRLEQLLQQLERLSNLNNLNNFKK